MPPRIPTPAPDLEAPIVQALAAEQLRVLAAGGDGYAHVWDAARTLLVTRFGFTPVQAEDTLALAAQEAVTPIAGLLDLTVQLRLLAEAGVAATFWDIEEAGRHG